MRSTDGARRVRLVNVRGHAIRIMTYDEEGMPYGSVLLQPEPGVRIPRIINKQWPQEEWVEVADGEFVPLKTFTGGIVSFEEDEEENVLYVTTSAVQRASGRTDMVMPTQLIRNDGDTAPEAGGLARNER